MFFIKGITLNNYRRCPELFPEQLLWPNGRPGGLRVVPLYNHWRVQTLQLGGWRQLLTSRHILESGLWNDVIRDLLFKFCYSIISMKLIHTCLKRGCWAWLSCTTLSLKVLKPEERDRLVENIGNHLINTQKFIRDRAVKNFGQADPEFGRKLQAHLDSVSNVSKINVVLVGTV